MESARGAGGENDAGETVRRVRDKLAWMQGIVQESFAHAEPGGGGSPADASDIDGGDGIAGPAASGSAWEAGQSGLGRW
jgi:hypothetical protein